MHKIKFYLGHRDALQFCLKYHEKVISFFSTDIFIRVFNKRLLNFVGSGFHLTTCT